jgi:diguanylate cyclase (GGDEF)-like protein/PAS domain S-box-containing protein
MEEINLAEIYKAFLSNIPCPVWIVDDDLKIIFLNKFYEEQYNIKLKDVIGKSIEEILPIEKSKIFNEKLYKQLEKSEVYIVESLIGKAFIQCSVFSILYDKGKSRVMAGVLLDITDRKLKEADVENQKNILRTIIDAVPESIFYKDKESKFIGYNKKFGDFYNKRGIKEILGKTDLQIYDDKKVAQSFIKQDKRIMKTKEATYYEHRIKDEKGNDIIEENVKIPVLDKNGDVWGLVGLSRDITERKVMEERLRYLSEIDILTGLYNRYSFEEKIRELISEENLPLGIIMGDVNGLKLINDTFGHLEGDILLKSISHILKEVCTPKGYVFRWGGDEFIILIPNCNESQCEDIIQDITRKCEEVEYEYVNLSIALGEGIIYKVEENIYDCIMKIEEKVYRQKLLEKKSIKSSITNSLKKSLEEKTMETNEHTERVANYASIIGKKMKLRISELDELVLAAKLHDIGKIAINEDILLKPGKLTKDEFEIIKSHTEKGYRIINASSELGNVAKCVLTHHERWDGNGYPLGLKGEEIPLMARIINVVDSYDVMTSERIYKKAATKEQAVKELENCSGTQFDPEIVTCFINYIDEK